MFYNYFFTIPASAFSTMVFRFVNNFVIKYSSEPNYVRSDCLNTIEEHGHDNILVWVKSRMTKTDAINHSESN